MVAPTPPGPPKKRHVAVIKIAPLAQIVLEPGIDGCPICDDIATRRADVALWIEQYKSVAPRIQDHERLMLALQLELREIRQQMTASTRWLKKALVSHPRCKSCGVLIGRAHASAELVREPFGDKLVCPTCRAWLDDAGTTVDAQARTDNDDPNGRAP